MSTRRTVRAYPFDMHETSVSETYHQLQRDEPMSRVQMPFGEQAWLATKYADVKLVTADPRFSRELAQGLDQPRMRRQQMGDGIMGMDPPDHTRLRRLVMKAFTARRLEAMRESVRTLVHQLIDEMIEKGAPGDLVEDLARPLPVTVICKLLGVPKEDHSIFSEWTQALVGDATAKGDVLDVYGDKLDNYVAQLVAQRREEPTDDLLGALVYARDAGDKLTENELIAIAGAGLLTGGVETVSTALPSFIFTLLTQPELLAQLRAQPEIMPTAVEELLRWVPINTAAMFARYATEDIRIGDVVVRTGDPVLPALHAANRDPEVFANPDVIDLTRSPNPHVAFGHGPHHCIGAQLARLELQEGLKAILERFPELRLADGREGVKWEYGVIVRGPSLLRVAW
ncbi:MULTISPECIES: cytochrome P450 [unclassified Amycolatopsis]|uniref:cytochrome P450 n=1 Tax=unclassified Amycolatopsis TaxID=2618356 RepID=UPI000563575B|nr:MULTISPECIES: cytochrome P450 [unclassified Amycolatopsis]MCG3751591.1 cytochrome P450 [Amycolatopsis sp. Poz14]